jgi:hypothetical protein
MCIILKSIKVFLLTISGFIITLNVYSQSLEGIWKGSFTARFPGIETVNSAWLNKMKVEIVLNPDSTYSVYTHSGDPFVRGDYTNRICRANYLMDSTSLFLQESVVLSPANGTACFKSMTLSLTVKKNTMSLIGPWVSSSSTCNDNGEISLTKVLKPIVKK